MFRQIFTLLLFLVAFFFVFVAKVDFSTSTVIFYGLMIALPFYLLRVLFAKKLKTNIEPAEKFIDAVYQSEKEYCLILRPFGNDGFISMENLFARGNILEKILVNWTRKFITLEEVIADSVSKNVGIDTVALVDPDLIIVPAEPKFISTKSENWKFIVSKLLRRAYLVVVIIPPGKTVSQSLNWEIKKSIQYGLSGRVLFVLPPHTDASYSIARQSLIEDLYYISPVIEDIPEDVLAIYPEDFENLYYWFPDKSKKGAIFLSIYFQIINEALQRIKQEMEGKSFSLRYLYMDSRYDDSDIYNSSSIELFQRRSKNIWKKRDTEEN